MIMRSAFGTTPYAVGLGQRRRGERRQMLNGLAEAGTGRYHAVRMVLDTPQHP